VACVVDPIFAAPRLAEVYDPLDPDRSDLDAYAAMVEEFGVHSVLDIGCSTGTFACLLARRGLTVTAVDPAEASLAVAQTKPGAERVRWLHGYATDLPPLQVDLATMTGNVAQVFVTDAEWASTLEATSAALRPGGRLVFETRDPAAKAWLEWHREPSYQRAVIVGRRCPGVGRAARRRRSARLVPLDLRLRGRRCGVDLPLHVALPLPGRGGRFPGCGGLPG
jgi:SAM-dependent methyltransferase